MTTTSLRIFIGLLVLVLVGAIVWYMKRDTSYMTISSYEECVAGGYAVLQTDPKTCRTPDGRIFTAAEAPANSTSTGSTSSSFDAGNATAQEIRNVSVRAGEVIASPLTVTGEAKGWYFEASFPIQLLDGNGKVIAQTPAQAQGEWMTTNFVPFKAMLSFARPSTATGTLVLMNDNPSGLPDKQRILRIPIRFSTVASIQVNVR